MTAIVVIPARLASTRFPRKVLASATGRPLVQHVVDRVRKCRSAARIIVAADDLSIAEALARYETDVRLTDPAHVSGTDRVAEIAGKMRDADIIVNVQGDEPEIEPSTIDALIERLQDSTDDMASVATPFPDRADPADPNLVKVIRDKNHRAIYFSRSPIPYWRDRQQNLAGSPAFLLHIGIYAYRRDFLLEFAGWPPGELETAEKLEQLRAIEHGRTIHLLEIPTSHHGIDTPEQYAAFVDRYKRANP